MQVNEKRTYKKKKKAVGGFFGFLASIFAIFFFAAVLGFLDGLGIVSSISRRFIFSFDLTLNTIFLNKNSLIKQQEKNVKYHVK